MKKVLSLFLSFVMLVSITAGLNLTAQAEENTVIYDLLDDGTAAIVDFEGENVQYLKIPQYVGDNDEYLVTRIGDYALYGFENLKGVLIDEGVTSIGEGAFACCTNLVEVILPDSLKTIGDAAFYECDNLVSVEIPDGVVSIGENAFVCNSLFSIILPKSLKTIGLAAFYGCDNLVVVFYEGDLPDWNKVNIASYNDALTSAELELNRKRCADEKHMGYWMTSNNNTFAMCVDCGILGIVMQFKDLKGYEIYCDYIMYTSVNNSFIAGTNPPAYTQFSPRNAITRAMLVAILYRMAGNPYANGNPHTTNPFTDIKPGAYYYDAACWALDKGITNQTTFRPNDNVTREQTARFLFAYAEVNNLLGDEEYKQVDISHYPDYKSVHSWAVEPLKWANYNDMITGTQEGYINPLGNTLRIHATRILFGFGTLCGIGEY